jgi:hypothetical protein
MEQKDVKLMPRLAGGGPASLGRKGAEYSRAVSERSPLPPSNFTTDLRVLVIATTPAIVATAGVISRPRSSPAYRPVSITSFADKRCQPRFAPNNERLA